MKLTSWKSLLPLLLSFSNLYSSAIAQEAIPLEGVKEGVDPKYFTLLTTATEGTTYQLPRRTVFKDFLSHDDKEGGAFRNVEGPLTFEGKSRLSSLSFQNLRLESSVGSSIFSEGAVTFSKLRSLAVESNSSIGGAIFSKSSVAFLDTNKITFTGNSANGCGAAILVNGEDQAGVKIERTSSSIRFNSNSCDVPHSSSTKAQSEACGGAIAVLSKNAPLAFKNNQESISFENNRAQKGGALYNRSGMTIFEANSGKIIFNKNTAHTGGAINSHNHFCKNKNSISFLENLAQVNGGAIAGNWCAFQNNSGEISFKDNKSLGNGGAIYTSSVFLTDNKDVSFINNHSSKQGGAIFVDHSSSTPISIVISADEGDVTFDQNKALFSSKNPDSAIRNSIYSASSPSQFLIGAKTDRSVRFYDPVYSLGKGSVIINSSDTQRGSVIFSGKTLTQQERENPANYSSVFEQNMRLVQGTLQLEKGACLSVNSFNQIGGTLNIGPGTILQTHSPESSICINKLCLTPSEESTAPATIKAEEGSIILSGTPDVKDPYGIFYEDHALAATPKEMQIILSGKTVDTKKFYVDNVKVSANPYGYQGYWSFALTENQKDQKELRASWHPSGQFSASPQKQGSFVPSTLWSLFDGLQTVEKTFLQDYSGNIHLLPLKRVSVSTSFKASFMLQENSEETAGFGLGHFGGDIALLIPITSSTSLLGGFTKMSGMMDGNSIEVQSNSEMIAATVGIESNACAFGIHSVVSYGEEVHNARDIYSYRGITKGTWKNYGWRASTTLSYAYPKCLPWVKLTPFAGVEFFQGVQSPFVETGYDPRRFSKSRLDSLAVPAGIILELRNIKPHSSTMTNCKLYYTREFYRKDPVCDVLLSLNNKQWKVRGSDVIKECLTLETNTTLAFDHAHLTFRLSSSQREFASFSFIGSGSLVIRY